MEVRKHKIIVGFGLFATKKYVKDEILFTLKGEEFKLPTRESIYVGNGKHIHDQVGQYINHSFNPTTRIDEYNVIALRDIEIDEEITFNYNENEINMACPFIDNGVQVCGKK